MEEWNIQLYKLCFLQLLRLPASPILKIQKFPLGMLILMQNLSKFVPLPWKLHNPYCHKAHLTTTYYYVLLDLPPPLDFQISAGSVCMWRINPYIYIQCYVIKAFYFRLLQQEREKDGAAQ